ncbi:MAG TPA: hypothetical protein PLQ57_15855 [Saprospiraceae bacterium]|nr:hypothetical protein [Saprospiraceae bacterium]HRG64886.1 hypothetical protein [Saprospiraceae bacterium]
MQRRRIWVALTLVLVSSLQVNAQKENAGKKWFVGSTLLLLGNLDDTNNPEYIQLNAGYRITPKDVVQFRFKRSIYAWPLGIPFGPDFDAPGLNYPGHARILAPQLGYQRFWWKGMYTSLYVLNAFEKYVDVNKKKIGNGFTLYTDFYLGYQFTFFNDRFFFEPAIGISFWPIRTGLPDTFRAVEEKWNNYFIQPGLDFGYKF